MNSLILFSRKNQLINFNKTIINNLNISNRNYSQNVNLKIYYNLNGFLIFSKPSQNFDIYTQCQDNLLISHRNYSNSNEHLIGKNDNISINDILKDVNEINESHDIHNPQINNFSLENQELIHNIQNNVFSNNHINENKIENGSQSEKVSQGFFSKLFRKNKKDEIPENHSEFSMKFENKLSMNENVIYQAPPPPQSTIPPSVENTDTININNIINETNNEINNSNNMETIVSKEDISINEGKIPEINNLESDHPLKTEPEPVIPNVNDNTIKKEDILNNDDENNGLFGWVSTLLHGKKQHEKDVINDKRKINVENNKENVNQTTNTTPENKNININPSVPNQNSTNVKDNQSIDNNPVTESKKINQNIPLDINNNEKENKKHSIKNLKSWFNKKMHPKKENQIETIENRELIDLNNEFSKLSIEDDLLDILNDSTVDGVENIINNATKGILLPTNNPLTNPPKDTFSFKLNDICHKINQYFFPLSQKKNEKELSGTLKLINRFTKTPLDAKKIVILGVHGWFPKRSIQKMVGDPTGTSVKFCQEMAYSVITYYNDLGIDITNDNVVQIPLSGEGVVENRVDNLYRQLEKRMDEVRTADIVLVSAHSQGTPVSVFILNRLLENKEIDPERQTVGMLSMAGIHHGPFPTMRENFIVKFVFNSKDENDLARESGKELFFFNDPHERITKYYHAALFNVLNSGVRICAIGSWFDQVVPLYSATLQGISHPNLYRAIYVERRDYTNDFFTSLIEFIMKLRNRGISDYGLLIHLSDLIMGSFVHGTQGHSTIYESDNVYKLLLSWITTSKANTKRIPYNQFFDQTQLCGIEDDKEEEGYIFNPVTYSNSSTSSDTTAHTTSVGSGSTTYQDSYTSTLPPQMDLPKIEYIHKAKSINANKPMTTQTTTTDTSESEIKANNDTETKSDIESIDTILAKEMNVNDPQNSLAPTEPRPEKENNKFGTEPPKMAMNMNMSKFNALHKLDMILEQLQSKRIRRFKSPSTLNTYYIPWIIGILQNSNRIKEDPELIDDLKQLMLEYQEWNPTAKSFKLLKQHLAPIQDMFRLAGITITQEDILKMKQLKEKQKQQQEEPIFQEEDFHRNDQNYMEEINDILYKEGKA